MRPRARVCVGVCAIYILSIRYLLLSARPTTGNVGRERECDVRRRERVNVLGQQRREKRSTAQINRRPIGVRCARTCVCVCDRYLQSAFAVEPISLVHASLLSASGVHLGRRSAEPWFLATGMNVAHTRLRDTPMRIVLCAQWETAKTRTLLLTRRLSGTSCARGRKRGWVGDRCGANR